MKSRTKFKITSTELSNVLLEIEKKSVKFKSETVFSYDFDLAIPYLTERNLRKHICFLGYERNYPLNSERTTYKDMSNIVFRNLEIEFENEPGWKMLSDCKVITHCGWHFEDCLFSPKSSMHCYLVFPWRGYFRFYKNIFEFKDDRGAGSWLFSFQKNSRVLLQKSDFRNSCIQFSDIVAGNDPNIHKYVLDGRSAYVVKDDSYLKAMIRKNHGLPDTVQLVVPEAESHHIRHESMAFLGNKGIRDLFIRCDAANYIFKEINEINSLRFRALNYGKIGVNFYLGSREKIDPLFDHALQHKKLLLNIRDIASQKHDSLLVNVLDKHLDRIEYYLTKNQSISFQSDGKLWFGHWQDRILYAWRRWSSDYYRSWLRPLLMVVLGYVILNAIPGLYIDNFTLSEWMEFSFRPVNKIPLYIEGLENMFSNEFEEVSATGKNLLRFVGLIQVIWIAIWSFAFVKCVKR